MPDLRRALLTVTLLWAVVTGLTLAWPVDHGLRAQYFTNADWVAPPAVMRVDPRLTTGQLYNAWRSDPPDAFSVQWSGYIDIPNEGGWTISVEADDAARVYVDGELIIDISGTHSAAAGAATVALARGAHRIVIHYAQWGGPYSFEWSWAREGTPPEAVPRWALTPRQPGTSAHITRWLFPLWWTASGVFALLLAAAGMRKANVWQSPRRLAGFGARVAVFAALGWMFAAGATEHARDVNNFKARGDQSGYLWDAQMVYANWNGRTPPLLVGERMRMPLYAGFLALAYSPRMSDDEFFDVAKRWNIRLALVLMGGLAVLFAWHLPPLLSFNLTLVVAFGYWVFKAGYAQPELLFYFLFFSTFLACLQLFRVRRPRVNLGLALVAGILAGLTFLTKALVPPFLALFLVAYGANELCRVHSVWRLQDTVRLRDTLQQGAWRAAASVVVAVSFLAVVSPYILNSKRVFGQYFYNANTTHFIWYDDGGTARAIMMPHMDVEGRIAMPPDEMPGMRHYLRTRSVGDITARLADGLKNIVIRSYDTYWYFYFVLAYLGLAAAAIAPHWRASLALARRHLFLLLFLLAYAVVYLAGTAFFSVTSSTGTTRFFITHLTPLLFTVSLLLSRAPFSQTTWRVGNFRLRAIHGHLAITFSLAVGLAFWWWPRLMTTYGGF